MSIASYTPIEKALEGPEQRTASRSAKSSSPSATTTPSTSRLSPPPPSIPEWMTRAQQRKRNDQQKRERSNANRRETECGTPVSHVPAHSLRHLKIKNIKETVSGPEKPPLVVMRVLGAVCLLLGENPTWLVARQLILDDSRNLIPRLENLDASSVTEKTLARLKRVIEHAGPSFSADHFETLLGSDPGAAAFGPLCEFVSTAFEMAQLIHEEKWSKLGLSGEGGSNAGGNDSGGSLNGGSGGGAPMFDSQSLGDANMRAKAKDAMKEQREVCGMVLFVVFFSFLLCISFEVTEIVFISFSYVFCFFFCFFVFCLHFRISSFVSVVLSCSIVLPTTQHAGGSCQS